MIAFVFRFNTLGGALGGFDNDHFIYLIRTDMLLAGEQPLRDFVDAELRGAWPALTYARVGVGAADWRPHAAARGVPDASARWPWPARWSFVLALRSVETMVGRAAGRGSDDRDGAEALQLSQGADAGARRLGACRGDRVAVGAASRGAGDRSRWLPALFRHDFALYIGAATVAAFVARDAGDWKAAARTVAIYAALTLVLALPSIVWVQVYEGHSVVHRAASLASVAVERARTELFLPDLDLAAPFSGDSLLLVTYYAFWAVPVVAAAAWAARLCRCRRASAR